MTKISLFLLILIFTSCSSLNPQNFTQRFKATSNNLEQTGLSSEYIQINRNLEIQDMRQTLRSELSGSPFDKHTWSSDCDCR